MNGMTDEAESLLLVDVQNAATQTEGQQPPTPELLSQWANNAYHSVSSTRKEVTIRLVDSAEMIALNRDFCGKNAVTNVLSFGVDVDPEIGINLLGDVVICHAVVVAEAMAQKKRLDHHYAHLITHGILHLCGYDHEQEHDAHRMEALEISLLENHGIGNPYSHR